MSARDAIAFLAGKTVLAGMRAFGKSGYHIPGMLAFRISPSVLAYIRKPAKTVFITGTNGKSTTTALVGHILRESGLRVAYNTESNNQPGIIASLLRYASIFNRSQADFLVLEVAEEALSKIVPVIHPQYLLMTNVQKDVPQVNQSPNYVREKISGVITDDMELIVNNDDPDVSSIGAKWRRVHSYGVARNPYSLEPDTSRFAITRPCPVCSGKLVFDYFNLPSVGRFRCTKCGFSSKADADYTADAFDLEAGTVTIGGRVFPMHYKAAHFVYDYLLAYAFAKQIGIQDDVIARAFDSFINIQGRLEDLRTGGKTVHYARFKQETPDTLASAIENVRLDPKPKTVVVALDLVENAWGPTYANTSYGFDVDFGRLADANVEKFLCVGRVVAHDTANILRYAGVPREKIVVRETGDPEEIAGLIRAEATDDVHVITWLHHYEEIRKAMSNG
ncbi:MurT ligase domain-containing protein [Gryllotalpicola ginsengisoli]|uniref:MurT ligase domain-containing protein n=1 Tax=Gryllotalpicola ginsengisoli TaxID=444608 RepID=UPI0003B6E6CA|nr:MurT ligase domain-containing protein [Gryllotalpicola ginsengisoli]